MCGTDLNLWGPETRGLCPNCRRKRREVRIKCAGRCQRSYPFRELESVRINFDPGYKEGTKVKVYYCSKCKGIARRVADKLQQEQEGALAKFERRRNRLKGEEE